MALDQWQARQVENIRGRHLEAAQAAVVEAQQYATYVARDLAKGRTSGYTAHLADLVKKITEHSAAIEAVDETVKIATTPDAP